MKSVVSLIFSLVFTLTTFNAHAIDFEDAVFPEFVTSTRALAMGNAFISKVNDASAVFYNPAGLGYEVSDASAGFSNTGGPEYVRKPHFQLSNFGFETNKGSLDAVLGNGIDGMRKILLLKPRTLSHTRIHALPNFTSRHYSAGYMVAKRTRGIVNDVSSVTGFEFADRFDHGPYAALNASLFRGGIKMGISGLYLKRKELNTTADPNTSTVALESSYKKGGAFIATAGGKLILPFAILPTFAGTIHNFFGNEFSPEGPAGAPAIIPRSYDFGFSITPQLGTSSRIHLEVNIKDFRNIYSTVSKKRKILGGLELDFSRVFFVRIGYGDGFGSAGLGVRWHQLEFDLTSYAVDTTTASIPGQEDRRSALSISSRF